MFAAKESKPSLGFAADVGDMAEQKHSSIRTTRAVHRQTLPSFKGGLAAGGGAGPPALPPDRCRIGVGGACGKGEAGALSAVSGCGDADVAEAGDEAEGEEGITPEDAGAASVEPEGAAFSADKSRFRHATRGGCALSVLLSVKCTCFEFSAKRAESKAQVQQCSS